MNNTKVGYGILCFDTAEFLDRIISEIKDLCYCIVIGVPERSFFNGSIHPKVLSGINKVAKKHDVTMIRLKVNCSYSSNEARQFETKARNDILDYLENAGCTHSMVADSDEIYTHKDFEEGVRKVIDEDIDVSYCHYVNYYKDTCYEMQSFDSFVPFLCKARFRYKYKQQLSLSVDLSRRLGIQPMEIINDRWIDITMHHMSWVRENIYNKMSCWTSKNYYAKSEISECIKFYRSFERPQEDMFYVRVPFYPKNVKCKRIRRKITL
jgi:hypothetical protein